jgi:large subunit ribosomal protein L36e
MGKQQVTPRQPKQRVSRMKGHLSKRTAFVRDIVKEVSGYVKGNSGIGRRLDCVLRTTNALKLYRLAPYERRVIELLRNSKDKRARKLAKKRLGTFGRAKRKVDEMTKVIAESRRAGH